MSPIIIDLIDQAQKVLFECITEGTDETSAVDPNQKELGIT